MKEIVLHRAWGIFSMTPEQIERYEELSGHFVSDYVGGISRDDPILVEVFREYPSPNVVIATIPDEATDWSIWDYDGLETVIYVLDGKLHTTSSRSAAAV